MAVHYVHAAAAHWIRRRAWLRTCVALTGSLALGACSKNDSPQSNPLSSSTPSVAAGANAAQNIAGVGAPTGTAGVSLAAAGSGLIGTGVAGAGAGTAGTPSRGFPSRGGRAGSPATPSTRGGGATAGTAAEPPTMISSTPCMRDALKTAVAAYFTALQAHDSSMLPLAANVKFTENGKQLMLTEGMWSTAGAVKFKLTAVDVPACSTVTEAVVPDGTTDIPYGLRLKHVDGKITEIETVAVRDGDYFVPSVPRAIAATKVADWETILPADKQTPRERLDQIINDYFKRFPTGACGFADNCVRMENGLSVGACVDGSVVSCNMSGTTPAFSLMNPRLILADLETGIVVGFVMFAGQYTDFHMFRVSAGSVTAVHAVLAMASSSGWN